MKRTFIKIACVVLMVVSFIAYIARASAFPIASENLLPWSAWFFIFALASVLLWQRVVRLLSFCFLIIWFYAFAANIVPETSTAAAPDVGSIERTPDDFVEAGEAIFNGKGKCSTCHNIGVGATKGRCPNMEGIGTRAGTQKPGMTAKEYLIESVYDPYAFLVPGYDKIMPPVWKPPISLKPLEIEAVIAFLQSQGGEVDLTRFDPPVDLADINALTAEALPPILTGDPKRGEKVFVEVAKCLACHNVDGIEKPEEPAVAEGVEVVTAPDLTEIAALNELRYIEESILKPNAKIVQGYGSATVKAGGVSMEGILVAQDTEKIVLRVKDEEGNEEERTIPLSELDPEPIAELANLTEPGYFWIQTTPVGATAPVSGELVEEDETSFTLKTADGTQKIEKATVKVQVTIVTFDDDEPIVGELIEENDEEIIINVNGEQRTIDKFDIDEDPTYSRAFGKRIPPVRSLMPDNFPLLLTVAQFNDLLAFLSTLDGSQVDKTAATEGQDATGAVEETSEE